MKVVSAGLTDIGRKRNHNEDSFLIDDELQLYVVADGMGGHAGGGTASKMAVETIDKELRSSRLSKDSPFLKSAIRDGDHGDRDDRPRQPGVLRPRGR